MITGSGLSSPGFSFLKICITDSSLCIADVSLTIRFSGEVISDVEALSGLDTSRLEAWMASCWGESLLESCETPTI